jgi:hypothetical protein
LRAVLMEECWSFGDNLTTEGFPRGRKSDSTLAFGGQRWKAKFSATIRGYIHRPRILVATFAAPIAKLGNGATGTSPNAKL